MLLRHSFITLQKSR